jgi:hypothetical protein
MRKGVMGIALTPEQIAEIMAPKSKVKEKPQTRRFPAPPQDGPLRYFETPELCVVAGYFKYNEDGSKEWVKTLGACKSQTYYRVQGIPMCGTHALRKLNEMLIDLGIEK